MFLRQASAFSLPGSSNLSSSRLSAPFSSSSSVLPFVHRKYGHGFMVSVSTELNNSPLTGVVFQPFAEVNKDALPVPISLRFRLLARNFQTSVKQQSTSRSMWNTMSRMCTTPCLHTSIGTMLLWKGLPNFSRSLVKKKDNTQKN
ncbi:ferritin-1, chloroplastic-like [Carica papaya]|uniref:ferritin-1, chloroplastic-like n=1 Tax=Carica papaya TaxID=3649 RepID=UPI000B8C885D|nr:ferritin-1, chloroplastic-like [Carica papaya]